MCRFILALAVVVVALPLNAQDRQPRSDETFQSLFVIRGVEFSEVQQKKIAALRQKYVPQLAELQAKRSKIMTTQQRRAWQQALRTAREANKSQQEARAAADAAADLSDEQKVENASAQKEFAKLTTQIQADVRGLLTDQQQTKTNRGNRNVAQRKITPTFRDVKYGPFKRNVLDVWTADSGAPTPVLVSIHGGGFRGGNKGIDQNLLRACLEARISVVAITYRLSDEAIAPAQHLDAARAIQFIRHNAQKWNFDPTRIAATGGSAGAGLSLWLGFHDDLADADNHDPVLRQSTRLSAVAVYNGQTSYDPRVIRDLFPGKDTYRHPALSQLFGIDFDRIDQLPKEKYQLFEQISALPHLDKGDIPALLMYASKMETEVTTQGIGIHHPKFAHVLKEKMDPLGIECKIETGVRRGDSRYTDLTMDFLKKHLRP